MSGASETKPISRQALEDFAAALLQAGGFSEQYAKQSAELLVWANMRGADSHGVLRIPRYIEMVELGIVKGCAEPAVSHEFGAICRLDGNLVPGAVGMSMATKRAIELAGTFGIGLCEISRISHSGAIGYFAEKIARAGMIGIVMAASKPLMVYHGARGEGVSTNPIAISAPAGEGQNPLIFDMSTAAVALGKIMAAKDAGRPIPPDWAVNIEGVPTTDPSKVKAVLPMAGPKGSGLSLMIEVLVSVLGGNPLISAALSQKKDNGFNGLAIAINPFAFGLPHAVVEDIAALARAVKGLPPAAGVKEVLLPGERGFLTAARRSADGIPITAGTAKRLAEEGVKRGVAVPAEFS
ncbi:malate/L-lactate dehydrogenase family protein [Rhizobium sp. CIAT894]|uniref:Ldh family oxidoreductase n=1 Tax=Rhizobium sp. CIAT894 TaxID=2020312 RepID=UPI000A1E4ECA|nr:Ldh family oxidoreductase [Rhizobium sp. CIAT894]ARM89774.1 malate/L-lactate dehydrogenase family protein [Rhizobium sp. CIAT894]